MSDIPSLHRDRIQRFATLSRYLTLLFILVAFIGSHIPSSTLPSEVTYLDKPVHFAVYMVLTFWVLTSWELTTGLLTSQHYLMVWLFGTLYGAFDEWSQTLFGRHCDMLDWLSDFVGIVFGLACHYLLRPLIHRLLSFKASALSS